MAKKPEVAAVAAVKTPADLRADLKSALVAFHLAGKRWPADEDWIKEAALASLGGKIDAQIAGLDDTAIAAGIDLLTLRK